MGLDFQPKESYDPLAITQTATTVKSSLPKFKHRYLISVTFYDTLTHACKVSNTYQVVHSVGFLSGLELSPEVHISGVQQAVSPAVSLCLLTEFHPDTNENVEVAINHKYFHHQCSKEYK